MASPSRTQVKNIKKDKTKANCYQLFFSMPVNFMTTLKAFIDNKIVIMKNNLSPQQIAQFRQDGFLVIEDFLSADELQQWRSALDEALAKRKSNKLPDRAAVYGKGDDADKEYYDQVFDQLINLWMDN